MLNSKIVKEKKPPFLIYADFESIFVSKYNGKQNPEKSYTNKYQNKLVVVMAINLYVLMKSLVSLLKHT